MAQKDARTGLDQLRREMIAHDRTHTTTGDMKGARRLISEVLLLHPPSVPLGRKLAACGQRNPATDSRVFCTSPACPVCMRRKGTRLFVDELWLGLGSVPREHVRWITILMFADASLDSGAVEMKRQHRRLQHVFKRFATDTARPVRCWGAREVERRGNGWLFHVHLLVDTAGADVDVLDDRLRDAFGRGDRQVQVKPLEARSSQRLNVFRLAQYMTKAKYHTTVNEKNVWLQDRHITELALWRATRVPVQWHRFTLNVRISR